MIQFLFNGSVRTIADGAADTTVLNWLRLEACATGTKEGCASGDCGACTAVLVSRSDSSTGLPLVYESFNTCITFVGAVHGKQLITVEQLACDNSLHPVQQAMVDEHGSQCGFCTPGFIMSMFALYHAQIPSTERAATNTASAEFDAHGLIERYLGGNLCRCTGYRPIVAAMQKAMAVRRPDQFDQNAKDTAERLQAIPQLLDQPQYAAPRTLSELAAIVEAKPQARLVAGSTDMALEVTQDGKSLPVLVSTKSVSEMQSLDIREDSITIGAAVSLSRCLTEVAPHYPTLSQLLLRFGSEQVRNQGTLGGNIGTASPIGDLPPVLLALGASITLQQGGEQRTVSVDDYFIDYRKTLLRKGEFIVSVQLPRLSADSLFSIYKVSKRLDDDISAVCCVIHAVVTADNIQSIRLAFGGMAAVPKRATRTEQALLKQAFTPESILNAIPRLAADFSPLSDARASASYRLQVAGNLLRRFQLEQATKQSLHVLDVGAAS